MQSLGLQRVRHDLATKQNQQWERRVSDNSSKRVWDPRSLWQERRKKAENLREGKQGGRRRAVTLIESGAERADSFLIVKAGVKGSTWISWRLNKHLKWVISRRLVCPSFFWFLRCGFPLGIFLREVLGTWSHSGTRSCLHSTLDSTFSVCV